MTNEPTSTEGAIEQITPIEATRRIEAGAMLLDVREPDEWQAGHAPMAYLIPLGQVDDRLVELEGADEIVVVCRSGGRSNVAAALLVGSGRLAANLAGGMQAWDEAGLEVLAADGEPGVVI